MNKKDYIPRSDAQFIVWAEKLMEISAENYDAWSIAPHEDVIGNTVAVFKTKYARMSDPNHGKIDTSQKNAARNPKVTDIDREYMGLNVYSTTISTVPPPAIPVEFELHFPAPTMVEVRNIRPYGAHVADKSEYGVRIYYGIMGEPDDTDRFRMSQRPQTGSTFRTRCLHGAKATVSVFRVQASKRFSFA